MVGLRCALASSPDSGSPARSASGRSQPELPAAWRSQFWSSPGGRKLLELKPKEIADLVPTQSGARFCRCPACAANEREDPLAWSIEQPKSLKCKRCGVVLPNDKYPAKVDKEIPQEKVEVLPGVIHKYPYHKVEDDEARYPDERIYLQAKIDYEARKYLAKAALYAAAEYVAKPAPDRDRRLATMACVIMMRFAQVYPAYATHLDQPGQPKSFQPAHLQPPYRRGYLTGKWEWSGCLDVPLNLLLAFSMLRDDPAWKEAGTLLGTHDPQRTVQIDFFRATADFARSQPEEYSENSLHVYRGLIAVGTLLGDQTLINDARQRLDGFLRRGFYHDGIWRVPESTVHRHVITLLGGWVEDVVRQNREGATGTPASESSLATPGGQAATAFPVLQLARQAGSTVWNRASASGVRQASWPASTGLTLKRRPILLGGAGIARLSVGSEEDALDVEVRALDGFSGPHFQRLAMRLAVAGRPVLDDLDDLGPTPRGWDLATASHNTVVVDGLNQREKPLLASQPVAGGDFLFFAADADFQVVSVEDPRAYPLSTKRYRHTLIASAGKQTRYALSVFEVVGGLQHDQIFHAAAGRNERWRLSIATQPTRASLLPPSITFLASARPEQGRWFVQSYGEFRPEAHGVVREPAKALLERPAAGQSAGPPPVAGTAPSNRSHETLQLHLLGDFPIDAITAVSPDHEATEANRQESEDDWRAGLVLRRSSQQGGTLRSTFVTLFEPRGAGFSALRRVGKVASSDDVIVVYIETMEGPEYVIVNLKPGEAQRVALLSGRFVSFDGVAVRLREQGPTLAGGTFVEWAGRLVSQARIEGTISASVRQPGERGPGWFLTNEQLPDDPAAAGRTLVVRHGDGTSHCWTLDSIQTSREGTRLYLREEPGFTIRPSDGAAVFYQFPRLAIPGPHRFRVSQMAR
jgi:hypothetical protein